MSLGSPATAQEPVPLVETRLGISGAPTPNSAETLADGTRCLTVTNIIIDEGAETRVPKRICQRVRAAMGSTVADAIMLPQDTASARAKNSDNPSCPSALNFSSYRKMRLTPHQAEGRRVLLAEGMIDDDLLPRLRAALAEHQDVHEIWIRSSGGNARVGNQAGRMIREAMMFTRVPAGWACFSACNFLFMGGAARYVDAGGHFVVHMFTHTQDRETIRTEVARGEASMIGLIEDIENQSALLASEDNDFLIRMGISRDLLTEVMYRTPAAAAAEDRATRRCLTLEEVRRYNVVNG